ncbi:hypothetical protein B0T18DRAFT_386525 [Schizothecium vesticola]|uniref:Uncharacterized protein n=1 Tax=Schizothecium vesticola TaxID=314040 RepID=A0AA40FBQ6_9PEZI|nr:hypothetical protein B0T18DRAFT_386525 [Schizothecium vesticola]
MSSRLTAPVSKFTRSISTTAPIARPSHLLHAATAQAGRKRHAAPADDAEASASTRLHSTSTSPHRPTLAPATTIPLMQGFRTSAPKPARAEPPTMDAMRFPDLSALDADAVDPYAHIRVPLLPDNATPAPWARRPEAVDAPLPRPVISVVAARPEVVLPAALTEVEGMGVDGVELRFAHDLHRGQAEHRLEEGGGGMIRDIWKGMVEDVFGAEGKKAAA